MCGSNFVAMKAARSEQDNQFSFNWQKYNSFGVFGYDLFLCPLINKSLPTFSNDFPIYFMFDSETSVYHWINCGELCARWVCTRSAENIHVWEWDFLKAVKVAENSILRMKNTNQSHPRNIFVSEVLIIDSGSAPSVDGTEQLTWQPNRNLFSRLSCFPQELPLMNFLMLDNILLSNHEELSQAQTLFFLESVSAEFGKQVSIKNMWNLNWPLVGYKYTWATRYTDLTTTQLVVNMLLLYWFLIFGCSWMIKTSWILTTMCCMDTRYTDA